MKLGKKEVLTFTKNTLLVIIGTLILAFGTAVFVIPFNIIAGGISSFAIILKPLLPFDFITMDLLITTITWGLFIIGFFTLGKSFALQTLVSTIVYPIGVSFFSKFVSQDFLGGFFNISEGQYSGIAILLAVLFGAIITGTGCALAFLGGGSTGGVDVLAFIICKIFKNLKSSQVLFAINAITVALGAFVFKDLILALLGILNAFIEAMVIDKVFLGGNRAFIAQIISKAPDKISKDIIEKLERTTTEIPITGGYSKKDGTMLMVSFTMREYREIINIVNRHDKDAFVTIHSAHQINGEGWTR